MRGRQRVHPARGEHRVSVCGRDGNLMAKSNAIEAEGRVVAALPNAMFRVEVDIGGERHTILATISGKMRKYYIRILPGDMVNVEISPYDLGRGRITYRGKKQVR